MKKVGFIKKTTLKFLTFLQEICIIIGSNSLYMKATRLHFKIYFGKDLDFNGNICSERELNIAANRHANMVTSLTPGFKALDKKERKEIYRRAFDTFGQEEGELYI